MGFFDSLKSLFGGNNTNNSPKTAPVPPVQNQKPNLPTTPQVSVTEIKSPQIARYKTIVPITENRIKQFCPNATDYITKGIVNNADEVFSTLNFTPIRIQYLLAHIAVESDYMTNLVENLNYSASRLMAVWPSRFKSISVANQYAHNPQALANCVYGGRLGNTEANDGWEFRGHGLLQITGRFNFQRLADQLNVSIDTAADAIVQQDHMLKCAAMIFISLNGFKYADADDIVNSTKYINGGTNGLSDRKKMLDSAKSIFN